MKLRKIKPGMIIFCMTKDELKAISDQGLRGLAGIKGNITEYIKPPCYLMIKENNRVDWTKYIETVEEYYGKVEVLNFSDLLVNTENQVNENVHEIQKGTKVRFKPDNGAELNLIAIEHQASTLFDTWICVDPNSTSKTGKCTLYNCFTEDLILGWK